jgi:hypothetical protein
MRGNFTITSIVGNEFRQSHFASDFRLCQREARLDADGVEHFRSASHGFHLGQSVKVPDITQNRAKILGFHKDSAFIATAGRTLVVDITDLRHA